MGLPCIAVLSSIIAKSNLIKQLVTKTGVNWRKCKGKFAVDVFHLENSTNAIIHAHMLKKLVSKNRALMELKFYKKNYVYKWNMFYKKIWNYFQQTDICFYRALMEKMFCIYREEEEEKSSFFGRVCEEQ